MLNNFPAKCRSGPSPFDLPVKAGSKRYRQNFKGDYMQKITPFLWYDDKAEEAANFYVSLFKNSRIGDIVRYDEAGAKAAGRAKGSVMVIEFQLEGQNFVALNGGP